MTPEVGRSSLPPTRTGVCYPSGVDLSASGTGIFTFDVGVPDPATCARDVPPRRRSRSGPSSGAHEREAFQARVVRHRLRSDTSASSTGGPYTAAAREIQPRRDLQATDVAAQARRVCKLYQASCIFARPLRPPLRDAVSSLMAFLLLFARTHVAGEHRVTIANETDL
jgi:hypothetical protein